MNKDFYLYGEISDSKQDMFGCVDDTAVIPSDLQSALADLQEGDTLNIYVNSPGGSVFAASAMTAMMKRASEQGIVINAYVDGIAASAASYLVMAADNIMVYDSSMMMIHKPSAICWGNANDFLQTAEQLEEIENSTMLPIYNRKLKIGEDELKDLIAAETWMGADEIERVFEVTREADAAPVAASISDKWASVYKKMPKSLCQKPEPAPVKDEPEEKELPDYKALYEAIEAL